MPPTGRDRGYLLDILDALGLVRRYVHGVARDQFCLDTKLQDAVIRRLTIVGEATRRLSDEAKSQFPEVPWPQMAAFRNIAVHEYDRIDLEIVWKIIEKDLPGLHEQILTMLGPGFETE